MLDSLLVPFRSQPQPPALPEGYSLDGLQSPSGAELNRLLVQCGDPQRLEARLEQALARTNPTNIPLGLRTLNCQLLRATSDLALNANLWDLSADPADPAQAQVLLVIVHAAMGRLRRELPGCSISVAAPSVALDALKQNGFVVDPGGIRAMGLRL